jgi:acetyl esterase/lipase
MHNAAKALVAAGALAALAAPILAQQRPAGKRLSPECRAEITALCGTDRAQVRSCLRERRGELSEACTTQLREQAEARRGAGNAGPPAVAPQQTLAYGSDPLQAIDLWVPTGAARPAPLVLFVHGGGWQRGSKTNAIGRALPGHLLAQGYALASIDYRLVPAARVEDQAADVTAALAFLLERAGSLGIDRDRVVLTGHSAGAHLVALVGTDERYLKAAGLSFADLDGVMPNDGAGYDVAAQLAEAGPRMRGTYEAAFGTDPERHRALSPTAHAAAPNAPAFLLLHAARPGAVAQARKLAEALQGAGTRAEIAGFPGGGLRGHIEINRRLGEAEFPATAAMDAWLKQVLE